MEQGRGFGVLASRSAVCGSLAKVWGLGFGVWAYSQGLNLPNAQGSGFEARDLWIWGEGLGFEVWGL